MALMKVMAAAEVNKAGVFTIPGKRLMFAKEVAVKAQPARTVVKAFLRAVCTNYSGPQSNIVRLTIIQR